MDSLYYIVQGKRIRCAAVRDATITMCNKS